MRVARAVMLVAEHAVTLVAEHAAIAVAAHAATAVVVLAAMAAAEAVASTVVEAAATAVAVDTGKIRLDARNEKPALLRQSGLFRALRIDKSSRSGRYGQLREAIGDTFGCAGVGLGARGG
jgi:hypothetical protein